MLRTTYLCILVLLAVVFLLDGAQAYYGGRCSQEATRTHRVSVDLYIMSKCPYGAQAVEALPTVVDEIGFAMDLSIDYIGNYDPKAQLFGSLHGATEVEGDAWQLCAMNHYRSNMSEWVDFLACMSKDYKRIPANVEACSDAVGLDYSLLESCMNGTEADQLLKASITKAATNHITLSPTFVIGGRQYVGERTPTHLINAICYSEGEWSDSVSSGGDDGESVRLWWSVAGVVVTLGVVTGVVGGFGAYLWRRNRRRQSGVSQENGGYQMVDVVVEAKTVN